MSSWQMTHNLLEEELDDKMDKVNKLDDKVDNLEGM